MVQCEANIKKQLPPVDESEQMIATCSRCSQLYMNRKKTPEEREAACAWVRGCVGACVLLMECACVRPHLHCGALTGHNKCAKNCIQLSTQSIGGCLAGCDLHLASCPS